MAQRKKPAPTVQRMVPTAENISFDEGENVYAASVDAGHRVDPRAQKIFVCGIALVVIFVVGLILPKDIINEGLHNSGYNSGYTFSWFIDDLTSNFQSMIGFFAGMGGGTSHFDNTFFRSIIVALTGAGLALTGAIYQGSFKNAFVSPSTLGVMSGASLGMVLWVVFFVADDGSNVSWISNITAGSGSAAAPTLSTAADVWSAYGLSICTFVGSIAVVGLVLLVMKLGGRTSGIMMIIAGQVIGGVMGAVVGIVRYYYMTVDTYGAKSTLVQSITIQSFYRTYTWVDVVAVGIPLALCFIVIMRERQRMMALQFSEEEARSMGIDARRMRIEVVGLCTLLTAILIAFCGMVGFVGFLVPHLARRLVGPNFKYLLPASLVLGSVFVLSAYVLVSLLLGPDFETMTGMFIAIGGAAVFLVQALRGKGGARGAF